MAIIQVDERERERKAQESEYVVKFTSLHRVSLPCNAPLTNKPQQHYTTQLLKHSLTCFAYLQ